MTKVKTKIVGSTGLDRARRPTGSARAVPAEDSSTAASRNLASFMAEARERFKECAESPNEIANRTAALDDLRFYNGDQWPADVKARLTGTGRPALTINRIKPPCRQVICSLLQDRPSIKVYPVDDHSDVKTAEVFQGLIRHIEVNSMADVAYDTALNGQVIHGFGVVRIITDYPSPFSFEQEIYIKAERDPFSWYFGPALEADGSDRDYAFKVEDLTPGQYAQRFGKEKSQFSGLNDFTSIGNQAPGWGSKNRIRVAEYYYRTHDKTAIVQFPDGAVVEKSSIPDALAEDFAAMLERGELQEREAEIPRVHWCTINGVEKLESRDWPGMHIPVIQFLGDEQFVDGQRVLSGVVRDAKDPQRQYNYFRSKMTETIALAPSSPWVIAEGQDEGHEKEWDSANRIPYSALRYKPTSVAGHPVGAPQRNMAEPPIQAMVVAAAQYEDDIKATTQVYDSKLGARSNEVSGRAIQARKTQSDIGNFTFANNLARALRFIGVVLLDVIPKVYDVRTVARIIGEDEQAKQVQITKDPTKPAVMEQPDERGNPTTIYNIGVGQYDVAVGIGPNYLTKRQEAFDMMAKLVNSYPELMKIAGDLLFKYSDVPGASEIAARLKKLVPPELTGEGNELATMPPKVRRAFEELLKQHEILTTQLEQAVTAIKTDKVKTDAQMEIERLRVASAEHQTALKMEVEALKVAAKANTDLLAHKFAMIESMITKIVAPGPVEGGAPPMMPGAMPTTIPMPGQGAQPQ